MAEDPQDAEGKHTTFVPSRTGLNYSVPTVSGFFFKLLGFLDLLFIFPVLEGADFFVKKFAEILDEFRRFVIHRKKSFFVISKLS